VNCTVYLKLVLLRKTLGRTASRRVSDETHDSNKWSMLIQDLGDFVHTVAVLREHDHSRSTDARIALHLVIEAHKMIENDLLQFCQLGMPHRYR